MFECIMNEKKIINNGEKRKEILIYSGVFIMAANASMSLSFKCLRRASK